MKANQSARRSATACSFWADRSGVSSIIGDILLVGIAVLLAGVIAVVVAQHPGPTDRTRADLEIRFKDGTGGFGTGDETVNITHRGGEPLFRDDTAIIITVGSSPETIKGIALDQGFADQWFRIGDQWNRTTTMPNGTFVTVDVAHFARGSSLAIVASETFLTPGSCDDDTDPPTVSTFTQTPADVLNNTTGSVTVNITVGDDCSGVDETVNPALEHRVNDGTNPPYTDNGAMTKIGTNQWSGSFAETWSSHTGKTLEYRIVGMKDLQGNTGNSAVQSDFIQGTSNGTTLTYVDSQTTTTGTVTNFANAQSATDAGAEATLQEAGSTSSATADYDANAVISSSTWSNPSNGFTSDNAYATTSTNNPNTLRYGHADAGGSLGTIVSVVMKAEVSITSHSNDGFELTPCMTTCGTTSSPFTSGLGADTIISYNITNLRPGGGAWSWADIDAFESEIDADRNGGRDGTWRVDRTWLEVKYTTTTYDLSVDFHFTGIPSGSTHVLELQNRVSPGSADTFDVQVWDGSTWNTRLTFASTTANQANYTLTVLEYNSGAPDIRFVDNSINGDDDQTSLLLDYARIRTT